MVIPTIYLANYLQRYYVGLRFLSSKRLKGSLKMLCPKSLTSPTGDGSFSGPGLSTPVSRSCVIKVDKTHRNIEIHGTEKTIRDTPILKRNNRPIDF